MNARKTLQEKSQPRSQPHEDNLSAAFPSFYGRTRGGFPRVCPHVVTCTARSLISVQPPMDHDHTTSTVCRDLDCHESAVINAPLIASDQRGEDCAVHDGRRRLPSEGRSLSQRPLQYERHLARNARAVIMEGDRRSLTSHISLPTPNPTPLPPVCPVLN